MKKLLLLITTIMLTFVLPTAAEQIQILIINGEEVSKTVTKMTFNGDLVVLEFSDKSAISEDMSNVVLRFYDPTSINNITAFQLKKTVEGTLLIEGLAAGTQVTIFDAAGKQMIVSKESKINVSALKSGVYVLKAGNQIVKFAKR